MESKENPNTITVTARFIRSFEHRNVKNVVLHNIDINTKTEELLTIALRTLKSKTNIPPPIRNYHYGKSNET